jgi:hypothetical protein
MNRGLRITLWLLLLLSANALQVVASTHWHNIAISSAAGSAATPDAPPVDFDNGGCVLCQAAAHANTAAPPPAPWTLFAVLENNGASVWNSHSAAPESSPSHAWQGRAPPLA